MLPFFRARRHQYLIGGQLSSRLILGTAILCAIIVLVWALPARAAETRCGWYQAPTPGNLWLTDRQATWSIMSQGEVLGPDAAGLDNLPPFSPRQFVETNVQGSGYGYGCACMVVDTQAGSRRIVRVRSGKIVPLDQCRRDKRLPRPRGEG